MKIMPHRRLHRLACMANTAGLVLLCSMYCRADLVHVSSNSAAEATDRASSEDAAPAQAMSEKDRDVT
ncbi:MAG TPA: hypothetical protein VL793_17315, partial [Patescibacteria group bacterium]|nr:hypothetical protein [Patescibacteria group bacterium]